MYYCIHQLTKGNEMSKTLYAAPAYGRTYANAADVLHDWNDGKDFKIIHGPYVSKGETGLMLKSGIKEVVLCFGNNRQVTITL